MSLSPVFIGSRTLGDDHPPMLIAELSGNHNGSLDRALRIVEAAADSGAHAIKLQTYTRETLTIDSTRPEFFIADPSSPWHGRRLWELYQEAHTPWEWHPALFEAARSRGLLCISTAFCETSVKFLVDQDVDAIKIASFELVNVPLIEAAARTRKAILISAGMGTMQEIDDAVKAARGLRDGSVVLLKCTSAYPSTEDDAHLRTIADYRDRFRCQVGLSDHTLAPFTAYAATALGATVIEKHITLRRSDGGVDADFSLEPDEFKSMAEGVAATWKSLGRITYGVQRSEGTSLLERPSIYVVEAIAKGEILTERNLRVIRPNAGLPPKLWKTVLGQRAAVPIQAGTPLALNHLQLGDLQRTDANIVE